MHIKDRELVKSKVTLMIGYGKGLVFHTVHIAGCDEKYSSRSLYGDDDSRRTKCTDGRRTSTFLCRLYCAKKNFFYYHDARRFWQGTIRPFRLLVFWQIMDSTVVDLQDETSLILWGLLLLLV
jgi:hypothetical protein